MAAKPVPSANVIELTVTVLLVPTFLLLKVEVFVVLNVSKSTRPDRVNVVVAVLSPSYVLLAAEAVAVKVFATIFPVAVD